MSRHIRIIVDHREVLPLERLAKLALSQARTERQQRKVQAALEQLPKPNAQGDAA